MIVAPSTTLLADSRSGGRGGILPWALLVSGSVASVAANVAVAEPIATGMALLCCWVRCGRRGRMSRRLSCLLVILLPTRP